MLAYYHVTYFLQLFHTYLLFLHYILLFVGKSTKCRKVCYNGRVINNIIGKNIRALRKEQGITQTELGLRLGFCNQTISFWETGQREPDLDSLLKIAKYFQVSLDDLLDFEL